MKMEKKKIKASTYWYEVSALFIKAVAFGIVNLFNQPEIIRDPGIAKACAIDNNQSPLLSLDKNENNESLKKVPKFA